MKSPCAFALLIGLSLLADPAVGPRAAPENLFQRVGFDQRLGERLPLETLFTDANGRTVQLGDYFGTRPVVLVLGYYGCPNLCGVTWQGLLETVRRLDLDVGDAFDVVALSIDPREGPGLAAEKRASVTGDYARPGTERGWHLLTGSEAEIRRVTDAAGFRYLYDPELQQYAHAAGLVVVAPDGVVSRYLFGVRFPSTDLRLAVVESSEGRVGSVVDQLLLLCYHYDPTTGRYGLLINNVLRGAGALTVAALVALVVVSRRRERRSESDEPDTGSA